MSQELNQEFKYDKAFRALQAGDFEEFKRMHQAGLANDDEIFWVWDEHLFWNPNKQKVKIFWIAFSIY